MWIEMKSITAKTIGKLKFYFEFILNPAVVLTFQFKLYLDYSRKQNSNTDLL